MAVDKAVRRQLHETPVGAPGPVACCDYCNAPLASGDDVFVLASRIGADVAPSRVVCDEHDVDPDPPEKHAVHVAASLTTAFANSNLLVLANVEEITSASA